MRAVAYARVSSEDQKERATIETQLDAIEKYCSVNNIRLVGQYTDEATSGALPIEKRPGGARLFNDLDKGLFDKVIIFKLSRVSRGGILDSLRVLEIFRAANIEVISLHENLDMSNPVGTLKVAIDAYTAEQERENIRLSVVAGHERSAGQGKWQGGTAPFGYRVSGQQKLEVAPEEAEIVREIFAYYLMGMSQSKIATLLNERGTPHPKEWKGAKPARKANRRVRIDDKQQWWDATIGQILGNSIYTGVGQWRKVTVLKKHGEYVGQRNNDEKQRVAFETPVIIPISDFERVQELKKSNKKFSKRNAIETYRLRGLIRCGVCNRSYQGRAYKKKVYSKRKGVTADKKWIYYSCSSVGKVGQIESCPNRPVRAELIEGEIQSWLEAVITTPNKYVDMAMAVLAKHAGNEQDLHEAVKAATGKVEEAQEEKRRIFRALRKGLMDETEVERELTEVRKEIEYREGEVNRLICKMEEIRKDDSRIHKMAEWLRKFQVEASTLTDEDWTQVFRTFVNQVIVSPSVDDEGKSETKVTFDFIFNQEEVVKVIKTTDIDEVKELSVIPITVADRP